MKHSVMLLLALGLVSFTMSKGLGLSLNNYEVIIDVTSTVGDLKRIWDNTGLSPPGPGEDAVKYLTSRDMFVNLALVGSLPFKAISHVRIHWLLDLIRVRKSSVLMYDFNLLENLLLTLRAYRMRPGFELMGNPGQLFSDLSSNPSTVQLWQDFIANLAGHLVGKFGREEVMKWRFELWNEPDSKQYNILNLTVSSYLKYAAASMKGLAEHGLRLSGPAGTFRDFTHHNISWSFLQMCNTMIALTGSCGIEAITFHKKGEGLAEKVVSSTTEFYSTVTTLYPLLKNVSFANTEADVLSGWWREEKWRGDVSYAAYVCEIIMLFLSKMKGEALPLSYLSNDNGFMNEPSAHFNQRTLLTRFQFNNSEESSSQFVRKPVMVVMALLSYLGPKELPVNLKHPVNCSCNSRLAVLAASDGVEVGPGWNAAVILSVSPGNSTSCSDNRSELRFKLPFNIELKYVVYQLDNKLTNPRHIWELNGEPDHPKNDLLLEMRKSEGPANIQTGSTSGEELTLNLQLSSPSVTMVHLCSKPQKPPAKVIYLHAINVTHNQVLLLWQDSDTRCVKTYEVYFCNGNCPSDNYQLISDGTNIMLSYQFTASNDSSLEEATRGSYKVRALDYWDQAGIFSDVHVYK